jgi:hypothetical protein
MKNNTLPLKQLSIQQIYNEEPATYEVPIYQRNYAWEKTEIFALVQDVYDAYTIGKDAYFIGTLVSFKKGDNVYEVIDGQQRLTTINLVLRALKINVQNKLTYRARRKSSTTLESIPYFKIDDKDIGIFNGFKYAEASIREIVKPLERDHEKYDFDYFKEYFLNNVYIIHYQVPKDIDLNHYFEIMNSRGEQLEKHEIIKARLVEKLDGDDKAKFSFLWDSCSEMNAYIQQKYRNEKVFGDFFNAITVADFDSLPKRDGENGAQTIAAMIDAPYTTDIKDDKDKIYSFQSIIDFPNFLLIVLKITRVLEDKKFDPKYFTLDDKELIKEFEQVEIDERFVKKFSYNLLKSKFFLDNYIVHHTNEDEKPDSNPWELQIWNKNGENQYSIDLGSDSDEHHKLLQLLSMFEVSYTARQRKNYLLYCLLHLFREGTGLVEYYEFVSGLADKYFKNVYLNQSKLSDSNTPKPGAFDDVVLSNKIDDNQDFNVIYGDGKTEKSKGIPLFVFNYLDYKLWEKYFDKIRGEKTVKGDSLRKKFFEDIGCSDFDLEPFHDFYFSRTRNSLEHFFPQALVNKESDVPNEVQINCFGNYAMIGNEMNSSGSNWSPMTKLTHYLDSSGKISKTSVASLKFMIMMQRCKDANGEVRENGLEWNFDDIKDHQKKMLDVLGLK